MNADLKFFHVAQPEDCDCLAAVIVDDEQLPRAELAEWVRDKIKRGFHVTRYTPDAYRDAFPTWGCPEHPHNRYSGKAPEPEQPTLFGGSR